jgi:two-component system, NtrC family, response regulator AtoC
MRRDTILVAEDDAEVREYLGVTLRCAGYEARLAADGEEVLGYLRAGIPASAILLDIMMPNKDGFEILREIRQIDNDIPVIMLSGMSSPLNVVQAMKSGATDFLAKPVDHADLGRAINHALNSSRVEPIKETSVTSGTDMFFGTNPLMRALRQCLPRVASSDVPILIQGETGTGKEVLARQVHALSARADGPFVKLNCAAVPSELLESELFGYERGAFTGAMQRKPGVFEMADGGTILLDEIGDMDIRLQAKLLQVLQDQEFRRLGGTEIVRVQVRVIAATHRDLLEAISQRAFREDLYYRLNVFTLVLPSLRERRDDIVSITEFLISRHMSSDMPPVVITPRLREALVAVPWPGNIRQLENTVRKLMVLRDPELIASELEIAGLARNDQGSRGSAETPPAEDVPRKKSVAEAESILQQASRAKETAEAQAILEALHCTRWNRKQAAALLKIDYKALLYKMKKLSIEERAKGIKLSA